MIAITTSSSTRLKAARDRGRPGRTKIVVCMGG
jgi:hypothetical protein